jgi:hypothetical protein
MLLLLVVRQVLRFLVQTEFTGVSRYLYYQDKDELNHFSDTGGFIDCLRDTDDDGTQGPRADDDGLSLLHLLWMFMTLLHPIYRNNL